MWVDKDDVFADDKVRDFKNSHSDARTHIRRLWKDGIPQFTLSPSRSSSTSSYFAADTLPMSNNATPIRSSTPITGPATGSPTASEIAEAFRLMSLGPPPESSFKHAEAEDRRLRQYSLPITNPRLVGDEDGEGMASGTIATVPFMVGGAAPAENQRGVDSDDPDYQPDMRPCPRGCSPLEYCHGPHLRRHHPYLSDLDPHQPGTWSMLTSIMRKLQSWSIDYPISSKKTTKIPLRFRHPTLPKGWVYSEEHVEDAGTAGPSKPLPPSTLTPLPPLGVGPHHTTRDARHRQYLRALNTTGALPTSPSTSLTGTDAKSQRGTSRSHEC